MNNQLVYWKMKNGKSIDIDYMDLNHLRNTLKMIVRNSQKSKLSKSIQLNGDMANEFNNSNPEDEYSEEPSAWDDNNLS